MKLQHITQVHHGDRPSYQDAMNWDIGVNWAFFILADGLGGLPDGHIISKALCETLKDELLAHVDDIKCQGIEALLNCYTDSLEHLRQQLTPEVCHRHAETTLALLWLDEHQTLTLHSGDTRIYRMDPDGIQWRTRDHSIAELLLEDNDITEEEMAQHPDQNQLTQSIGLGRNRWPSVHTDPPPMVGETFMLCTDGLWSQVNMQEIEDCGRIDWIEESASVLTAKAYQNGQGHSDNITWQGLRIL